MPGVDLAELAAAVRALQSQVDLLGMPPAPINAIHSETQPRCAFVVMPFGPDELQVVYEEFVKPTLEMVCSLRCVRGDDIFGSNVVMDDVSHAIGEADVLVADLTGRNANVFYEVGIAHALDKPVLLIAQSLDDVPFDLRHRRILLYEYSPRGCKRLEQAIAEHMNAMLGTESVRT